MNEQREMSLMGQVIRPKYMHPLSEIRACKEEFSACRLALNHAHMDQQTFADLIHKSKGYVSMLFTGDRSWTRALRAKLMHHTGSMAPLQWEAMQEGAEVYADPVQQELAQLEARKQQLLRQEAA